MPPASYLLVSALVSRFVAAGGLTHGLGARRSDVAFTRIAARRTNWTGRRDFIGAWIRANSGVSADQSFIPSERRQGHGDTRQRQPQAEPHAVSSGRERMPA